VILEVEFFLACLAHLVLVLLHCCLGFLTLCSFVVCIIAHVLLVVV
jgi:hypothetical protein